MPTPDTASIDTQRIGASQEACQKVHVVGRGIVEPTTLLKQGPIEQKARKRAGFVGIGPSEIATSAQHVSAHQAAVEHLLEDRAGPRHARLRFEREPRHQGRDMIRVEQGRLVQDEQVRPGGLCHSAIRCRAPRRARIALDPSDRKTCALVRRSRR